MTTAALLYGANGFTGRAIAHQLAGTMDLVLGGRDEGRVRAVAEPLGLGWRVFDLADPGHVAAGLAGITAVLHAAGPFAQTARPMVDACLASGVHYLDLGGEWPVFAELMARDAEARAAGVMLLPGTGLTVAATDCLMARAVELWPDTVRLCLGISRAQVISRGSVTTMVSLLGPDALIRRGGELVSVPAGSLTRAFDFGGGLSEAVATSWADVVTGEWDHGSARHRGLFRNALGAARGLSRRGAGDGHYRGAAVAPAWRRPRPRLARAARRRRAGCRALYHGGRGARSLAAGAAAGAAHARWLRRQRADRRRGAAAGCCRARPPPGFATPARAFGANFVVESGAGLFLADGGRAAA
jgi:short subunit dehydrogenase-like uncharacterized protein